MKQITLLLSISFLLLISCTSNKNSSNDRLSISIIESYSSIQLLPAFINVNEILLKARKDSMLKHPSGNILLDKMEQDTTREGPSIGISPFWEFFAPNVLQGKDGINYFDTSSILGYSKITDTTRVLQCLHDKELSKLFPGDLDILFAKGVMFSGYLKIHGTKKTSKNILLDHTDILKLYIKRETDVSELVGVVAKKVSDLIGNSRYSIALQLDNKVLSQLNADAYTVIISINGSDYSGSIIRSRINDPIPIGEIDNASLDILKNQFKDKIILSN